MSSPRSAIGPLVLRRAIKLLDCADSVQFIGPKMDTPGTKKGQQSTARNRVFRPSRAEHDLTKRLLRIPSGGAQSLVGFVLERNSLRAHACNMHMTQTWCQ